MVRLFFLWLALVAIASAEETCDQKREELQALEIERDAEDVGRVMTWLTWTKPTSNNKKYLDQRIQILKFEMLECDRNAGSEQAPTEKAAELTPDALHRKAIPD